MGAEHASAPGTQHDEPRPEPGANEPPHELGLRERKNVRTREAIERAALELALEQGFRNTTVQQIAERAEVAPRTVFGHFPTKEAIFFGDPAKKGALRQWIEAAEEAGEDLISRLGDFVRAEVQGYEPSEVRILRWKVMLVDPDLREKVRGGLDRLEAQIATHLAAELGLDADDAGPRVVAAGLIGLFLSMIQRATRDPASFDPVGDCERGLIVLRAGMDALRAA